MQRRFFWLVTTPTVATSLLLFVLGATAAWYVERENRNVADLVAASVQSAQASETLVEGIRNIHSRLQRFVTSGNVEDLQAALEARQNSRRWRHLVDDLPETDERRSLFDELWREHERIFDQIELVLEAQPIDSLRPHIAQLSDELADGVLQRALELHRLNRDVVERYSGQSRSIAGQVVWGLLALGLCGGAAGLLAGFGIARHVVRRVETSEREAARAEQLAALGQLSAGLAHELRNPLMIIKTLVETAMVNKHNGRMNDRDLEVLDEEVGRLERLSQSFLDFARPPQLQRRSVELGRIIEETVQFAQPAASQRGVKIYYDGDGHIPFHADGDQLRQVLLNLMVNAIDVLPQGGTVTVHADEEAHGANGHRDLVIKTVDNGPGIPPDLKERIFEPFVTTKETGLGLGLSTSRRIVEDHGGRIDVENLPGGGTEFTVRLPIRG